MPYKQNKISVTIDENVATLILNRPEKFNAVDEEMVDEFNESMKLIGDDENIRSVIITGAGNAFCSGADRGSNIFGMTGPSEFWIFMQKISDMILNIRGMPKPVIAAVNGVAVGGGCNIALACDIIIASETASFQEIYSKIGIHPDAGGTYFLPRLTGINRACELMFTGRPVGAVEAKEIGMVNRVVAPVQLANESRALALELTKRAPLAIQMMKKSLYQSLNNDLETMLEQEARALSVLVFSEDHREAISALKDGREALFKRK